MKYLKYFKILFENNVSFDCGGYSVVAIKQNINLYRKTMKNHCVLAYKYFNDNPDLNTSFVKTINQITLKCFTVYT